MNPVSFKPSEAFKELADKVFEEQKQVIQEKLPHADIQHIAGTAIPGLLTKGDLDINVRVEKEEFAQTVEILKTLYEINQPHNWTDTYASFKDDTNLDIDFGVQLTVINSPDDYFVTQRDLLLQNPDLVKELNELKKNYEGTSMEEYRKAKGEFFERIIK